MMMANTSHWRIMMVMMMLMIDWRGMMRLLQMIIIVMITTITMHGVRSSEDQGGAGRSTTDLWFVEIEDGCSPRLCVFVCCPHAEENLLLL